MLKITTDLLKGLPFNIQRNLSDTLITDEI